MKIYRTVARPALVYGGRDMVNNEKQPRTETGGQCSKDTEVDVWSHKEK